MLFESHTKANLQKQMYEAEKRIHCFIALQKEEIHSSW